MSDSSEDLSAVRRELGVWHSVAHSIQMYAMVTMDGVRLHKLIGLICDWSYAHRQGNGELDNDVLVAKALERLANRQHLSPVPADVKPRLQLVLDQLASSLRSAPAPHAEIALNGKLEIERLLEEAAERAGELERVQQELQALRQIQQLEALGEVVVSTNEAGECVAVTRQNSEGQILSVIWEAPGRQTKERDKGVLAAIGGPV